MATEAFEEDAPLVEEVFNLTTNVLGGCVLVAIAFNVIFFIAIFRCTQEGSRIRLFLKHMVFADLVICFFTLSMELGWRITSTWRAGDSACRIFSLTKTVGLYAESYVVLAMSVDSCYAVFRRMDAEERYQRAKTLLLMGWMAAFIFSVPQAVVYHEERSRGNPEHTQCVTLNSFISLDAEHTYIGFSLMAVYVLPLAIILVVTCLLFRRACMDSSERWRGRSISINIISASDAENEEEEDPRIRDFELSSLRSSKTSLHEQDQAFRERLHTGLQLRHQDSSVRQQARRHMIQFTTLLVTGFVVSHTPYAVLVAGLAVAESQYTVQQETALQISESLMIVSLSLSAILNPILYGLYIRHHSKRPDGYL